MEIKIMKKVTFVSNLELALEKTALTTRAITDLYNFTHGTSFSEKNLVLVQSGFRELSAIAQLGFTGNRFGMIIYSLQEKNAAIEVTWGVSSIVLDFDSYGNQKQILGGVLFDTIKQTNLTGHYSYYLFDWA